MRAHLPGRVLGTSSSLDARLTVLVAAIFAIFVFVSAAFKAVKLTTNCFIYDKISDLLLTFHCRFHLVTWYMKYTRGVILSGANFVPQGNNLSNRIREEDKGNGRGKPPISGENRSQSNIWEKDIVKSVKRCACVCRPALVRLARVPKYCVGSCFASRYLSLQSSKVLCRKISLLVLSAGVAKCCVGSSGW